MKLMEIFKLRIKCLGKANPDFTKSHMRDLITTSQAAQEYYLSGMYAEDLARPDKTFKSADGYWGILKKYGLYNKCSMYPFSDINPYLVWELTTRLEKDIKSGIVAQDGTVNLLKAPFSKVLNVANQHVFNKGSGKPKKGLPAIMLGTLVARNHAYGMGK